MNETAKGPDGGRLAALLRVDTTPDRLRLGAILTVFLLVLTGATAWFLSDNLVSETDAAANSSGEVLIATQQISASFAEADAAAVSVHLAGSDGNPGQRRLYELAMDRATSSLEDVARLVGDDAQSHASLRTIAARTTEYAGLMESARLASVEGLPGADSLLSEASGVNRNEITPEVRSIADSAQMRFDDQTDSTWYLFAILALAGGLVVLLLAQLWLARRFKRLVNVPLLLATIVAIVLLVFSGRAFAVQQAAFNDAKSQALDAIEVSGNIQQAAYQHRALSTTAVLTGQPSSALEELESRLQTGGGLLDQAEQVTSSTRDSAAATTIRARWSSYLAANEQSQVALARGNDELAQAITQGEASSTFNGFNTSMEAALLNNREEFLGELGQASDSLTGLRAVILLGALLAALLAWWGFVQRIGEYR